MTTIRDALADALSVVLVGFRLAVGHLPTLLVIFMAGAMVRNGVVWASVELSDSHRTLAGFVLPIAPMATLAAIILMLRQVASGLSWASFDGTTSTRQAGPYLGLLTSALIPFLTVYAAQGYLKEDLLQFRNETTYDEILGSANAFYGVANDPERAFFADGALLFAIVAVALVIRFLIGRLGLPARHVSWGVAAAYVEVIWLFLLATQFTLYQDRVWSWVLDRRFVDWVVDRWEQLIGFVGPLGRPLEVVAAGIGNLLTDANTVLLIPVAWLTVGAVALGQKIPAPTQRRRRFAAEERLKRVPHAVRRVGHEATADLRGRFTGLGNGIRLLAVGGLLPMLLFCLVFVIARQAGQLVIVVWRAVVGPVARDDALAFYPYLTVASNAVYTVLLVGLLAAAIDRIIRRREISEAEAPHTSAATTTP